MKSEKLNRFFRSIKLNKSKNISMENSENLTPTPKNAFFEMIRLKRSHFKRDAQGFLF